MKLQSNSAYQLINEYDKLQLYLMTVAFWNISNKSIKICIRWPTFCNCSSTWLWSSFALCLIAFITSLWLSINFFTSSEISHLVTTPTSFLTFHPIFQSSTMCLLIGTQSQNIGKISIGVPAKTASRVEFQPQCVQNRPVEEWHNTFN